VDSPAFRSIGRVELLICALTHYFALFSMLRRKTGV
jgi:hypothetical protein